MKLFLRNTMPKGHCNAGEISVAIHVLCILRKGDSHLNSPHVQRNTREDGRGKRSLRINLHLPLDVITVTDQGPGRDHRDGARRDLRDHSLLRGRKQPKSPSQLVEDQRLKDYLKQKPLEGRKEQHSCVFWLSPQDCTPHWTAGIQPERPKAPSGSGNGVGENYTALGNTRRSDLSSFLREPKIILNQNLRAIKTTTTTTKSSCNSPAG